MFEILNNPDDFIHLSLINYIKHIYSLDDFSLVKEGNSYIINHNNGIIKILSNREILYDTILKFKTKNENNKLIIEFLQ